MRILLQSGTIINEGRIFKGDLLIHNDRIEKIIEGKLDSVPGDLKIIDATGKYIIPGVIDDQVHFREPASHTKETSGKVAGRQQPGA